MFLWMAVVQKILCYVVYLPKGVYLQMLELWWIGKMALCGASREPSICFRVTHLVAESGGIIMVFSNFFTFCILHISHIVIVNTTPALQVFSTSSHPV